MSTAFDIALVGSGMKGLLQITREAEHAIDSAQTVFRLNNHPEIIDFLESKKPGRVHNLGEEYRPGERRDAIYQRMAQRVVEAFKKERLPVCLVTSGHPTYLVTPSQLIIKEAQTEGIRVRVVPGLSSLDNVFADIGFDPGIKGFQSYEATDLILRGVKVNPDTPLFLWQPGAFQNLFYSTKKSKPSQFSPLVDYLLQFYPPSHPVYVLRTPTLSFTKPECQRVSVETLGDLSEIITLLHIVFVPPLVSPEGYNNELLKKLEDFRHIEGLTEEWPDTSPVAHGRAQMMRDIIKRAHDDAEFCERLRANPEEALTGYELQNEELEMIVASNERKIFDLLGNEKQAFAREYGDYQDNQTSAQIPWCGDVKVINN